MNTKYIDKENIKKDEAWLGNNAAFVCPVCGQIYIVSDFPPRAGGGVQKCSCGKSEAHCTGKKDENGTEAWIEWNQAKS